MALAASYLGATLVPLNTWYKQTELAWTLQHCGLKLLVSATRFLKADYIALPPTIVPDARGAAHGPVDAPDFQDLKSLFFISEAASGRPDERRVGQHSVRKSRAWVSPYLSKNKK